MSDPERTCVGCRRRRSQAELVRVGLRDGRVLPTRHGEVGRGAYVCPDLACLEAAVRKRAFARAFRGPVTLDAAVHEAVRRSAHHERR